MKTGYRPVVIVAAVAALFITGNPVPAFSQMRDMPMPGYGEGHGQTMDMPMQGHGAEHGHMQIMMRDKDKVSDVMDVCLRHAEAIGLNDEQIIRIKLLHREMQKKQARFKADLTIARIDLMEIMEVKDFDLGKASSAVKKIAEIKTAHHLEMLKAMKEIRTILTDEQFKKMNMMMSSMMMHGRRN